MANFGQFLAKTGIFQKSSWKLFLRLQALTNCKVSEKSKERFSSNRESLGFQRLRVETKKVRTIFSPKNIIKNIYKNTDVTTKCLGPLKITKRAKDKFSHGSHRIFCSKVRRINFIQTIRKV